MFKTLADGFHWIESCHNLEKNPDTTGREYNLTRMFRLLELFNRPDRDFKSIHIAGSKGKGSTSAFVASLLKEAGFKTGLYNSPHVLSYKERITIAGDFFEESVYLDAINDMKEIIDASGEFNSYPTTFELLTLLGFFIFSREKCQWAVIETGLGGRIDSTNVILPEASLITPVEMEHAEILGDTLEKIAGEKAGIIKPGVPVFTSCFKEEVLQVMRNKAVQENSPLTEIHSTGTIRTAVSREGTHLNFNGEDFKLGLNGRVQGDNAALALTALKTLIPNIPLSVLKEGIQKASIPGRLEEIAPGIVIDGAHTGASVENAVTTFQAIYGEGVVIFGNVLGKDTRAMAKVIAPAFETVIISTPGTFKKSSHEEMEKAFIEEGMTPLIIKDPKEALAEAKKQGKPVLVTGSFYMAGEIKALLSL